LPEPAPRGYAPGPGASAAGSTGRGWIAGLGVAGVVGTIVIISAGSGSGGGSGGLPRPPSAVSTPSAAPASEVSVVDSAPGASVVETTPDAGSAAPIIGIAGVYVITEDPSVFSPGPPDGQDPLGCTGRRVPAQITVSLPSPGLIDLNYSDEPGGPPFDHAGAIDADNRLLIDYPDASGRWVEGRFELFGSEMDLLEGRLYSGDCTFGFTGKRQ
jgi:hypothetical protein